MANVIAINNSETDDNTITLLRASDGSPLRTLIKDKSFEPGRWRLLPMANYLPVVATARLGYGTPIRARWFICSKDITDEFIRSRLVQTENGWRAAVMTKQFAFGVRQMAG
jgi:hypothetical protein